jgi:hypothetical protein
MDSEFSELDGYWWAVVGGELQVVLHANGFWWAFGVSGNVSVDLIGPKIEPPAYSPPPTQEKDDG